MKVYLSPSDQHANVGDYPAGTSEKHWNRIIAEQTAAIMRRVPGVLVRVGEDRLPRVDEYADRVEDSDRWGADLHVCMHTNAGQGGTMVCVYPSAASRKLGRALLDRIAPLTPSADPGVVDRPDLYELNGTKAVAALIEYDRHDTPAGVAVIIAGVQSQDFAWATAAGICDYAGLELPARTTTTQEDDMPTPADVWGYVHPDKRLNPQGFTMAQIALGTNAAAYAAKQAILGADQERLADAIAGRIANVVGPGADAKAIAREAVSAALDTAATAVKTEETK